MTSLARLAADRPSRATRWKLKVAPGIVGRFFETDKFLYCIPRCSTCSAGFLLYSVFFVQSDSAICFLWSTPHVN